VQKAAYKRTVPLRTPALISIDGIFGGLLAVVRERQQWDPMRPSVLSTTMVQHHVKKPIGEFSLTLASMSAIFYLSVN
jgi:hypothetical protein